MNLDNYFDEEGEWMTYNWREATPFGRVVSDILDAHGIPDLETAAEKMQAIGYKFTQQDMLHEFHVDETINRDLMNAFDETFNLTDEQAIALAKSCVRHRVYSHSASSSPKRRA
jgi:hypothetical protein